MQHHVAGAIHKAHGSMGGGGVGGLVVVEDWVIHYSKGAGHEEVPCGGGGSCGKNKGVVNSSRRHDKWL